MCGHDAPARGPLPWFQLDETPAGVGALAGDQMLRCYEAREVLAGLGEDGLLALCPRVAHETRLEQQFAPGPGGWTLVGGRLRSTAGVRFEQPVDSHVANLLVACDGTLPVRELLGRAAAQAGVPADSLVRQGIGVVTQLLQAGFLALR